MIEYSGFEMYEDGSVVRVADNRSKGPLIRAPVITKLSLTASSEEIRQLSVTPGVGISRCRNLEV